ncbi:ubiquitin-conjugating enzyme/RWD-like protein [Mycena metata]|uniref:Ubiquitin-conjugating enzyme/RWD-like protein n=1 Tax=Mycena metata TaxID=1033252 RepID=A0AAD7J5Y0_9AGAR|nr:ubiquitin-conjugating enzyme/RWD-like protein [Mycena metata]
MAPQSPPRKGKDQALSHEGSERERASSLVGARSTLTHPRSPSAFSIVKLPRIVLVANTLVIIRNTPWEGGVYVLNIEFQSGFPERLPKMRFRPPLFHPNVYPSGTWGYPHRDLIMPVAARQDPHVWKHTKEQEPERFAKLLRSVKAMLHEPDITNPQQSDAYVLAKNDPKDTSAAKIRSQAADWTPDPRTGLVGYKQQPVKEEEA